MTMQQMWTCERCQVAHDFRKVAEHNHVRHSVCVLATLHAQNGIFRSATEVVGYQPGSLDAAARQLRLTI
jgi:hypothetical protein